MMPRRLRVKTSSLQRGWVLLVGAAVGAYGWTCVRLLSMLRCRRRQRASRCAWPTMAQPRGRAP